MVLGISEGGKAMVHSELRSQRYWNLFLFGYLKTCFHQDKNVALGLHSLLTETSYGCLEISTF